MDKQIEEMAKDMLDYGMEKYPTGDSAFTETTLMEQFYPVFLTYAEHLIGKGYRKIPENAVVLTKEEYERLLKIEKDFNTVHYCFVEKSRVEEVRKETAEKFAEMVSKAFIGLNCIDIDEWNWCQNKIDEIAKGIIDGK